jgi:hypothetical protein
MNKEVPRSIEFGIKEDIVNFLADKTINNEIIIILNNSLKSTYLSHILACVNVSKSHPQLESYIKYFLVKNKKNLNFDEVLLMSCFNHLNTTVEIVEFIIDLGVTDVNKGVADHTYCNTKPLHALLAGAVSGETLPFINLLVEKGADVNCIDRIGTPIICLFKFHPYQILLENKGIIIHLLSLGAYTCDISYLKRRDLVEIYQNCVEELKFKNVKPARK